MARPMTCYNAPRCETRQPDCVAVTGPWWASLLSCTRLGACVSSRGWLVLPVVVRSAPAEAPSTLSVEGGGRMGSPLASSRPRLASSCGQLPRWCSTEPHRWQMRLAALSAENASGDWHVCPFGWGGGGGLEWRGIKTTAGAPGPTIEAFGAETTIQEGSDEQPRLNKWACDGEAALARDVR